MKQDSIQHIFQFFLLKDIYLLHKDEVFQHLETILHSLR